MIIAIGKVDPKEVFTAAIAMAKDTNSSHELNEEKGQGSWLHSDGWGIAWLHDGKWQLFKSIDAIYDDPKVNNFLDIKTNYLMLHIRKKMGSEVAIENTHPFHVKRADLGDFVFCHNGYAGNKFNFNSSFKLKGKTDSEGLFYNILTIAMDNDLRFAIAKALAEIETSTGTNVILSSVDKSYIASKENHYPKYYTMQVGRKDGAVIVSSEYVSTLSDYKFEALNSGQIISVDHRTLEVKNINNHDLESSGNAVVINSN